MRKEIFLREREKKFFFSSFSLKKEMKEKGKREKREGEKARICVISSTFCLDLTVNLKWDKGFPFRFFFLEKKKQEMRKKENSFFRLHFCGGRNVGENRNLNLTPREGILANIRSFRLLYIPVNFDETRSKFKKKKGPCFVKNKVQLKTIFYCFFCWVRKKIFASKAETLGCP